MARRTWPRSAAKERFWREVIAEHAVSGLSVKAHCVKRGVSEASFFSWRRELAHRDAELRRPSKAPQPLDAKRERQTSRRLASPGSSSPPLWAQLHVTSAEASSRAAAIEIVLPAGVRVLVSEGASRQALMDVFAVLERPQC